MREFIKAASKTEVKELKNEMREIKTLAWVNLVCCFSICIYLLLVK